jgi:hypothetical protein
MEVLPPLDWEKVGGETWADVIRQLRRPEQENFSGEWFHETLLSLTKHGRMYFGLYDSLMVERRCRLSSTRLSRNGQQPRKETEKREFVFTTEVLRRYIPIYQD